MAPSTETGSIALSVEIITIAAAPAAAAASATFTEPNTLVLTPSSQSRSSSGTCLSAAAWNTMSGLNSANRPAMRSRSRTSAMRPEISAAAPLAASASSTACSAGSEFSITSRRAAPKVTMRSQISAPIEPPPPVTTTELAGDELLEPLIVDVDARPQQQVLDRDRGELAPRRRPNRAPAAG